MTIYRPRMLAHITCPILGTREQRARLTKSDKTVELDVRPTRVSLERNSHTQADTCEISVDWFDAGVDPRLLDDATVEVFIDNADEFGEWQPSRRNCRFVGVTKEIERFGHEDAPAKVRISCVDYTTLFLEAKPFGSSGVPQYSQNLKDAWATIVSQTPGADILASRIRFDGLDRIPVIGEAVPERFRKYSKVQTKPDTDAWAVWRQCVEMMGLISYIELDECVVTTATNYYSDQDAPVLIWGKNILEWSESRVSALGRRGIGITSYDPLSQKTLEALWPPLGDERVQRKRTGAKKVLSSRQARSAEEREYFKFASVTDQKILLEIAKCIYQQRSRQELEGRLTTHEMRVETESNRVFDLLNLHAGDTVRVEVEPENRQLLASIPSDGERRGWLLSRGYTSDAANLIIANMGNIGTLSSRFLTKRVGITLEADEDGGEFGIDINYCNQINLDGSATVESSHRSTDLGF